MPKSILIFKKILIITSVVLLAIISYRFLANKYHSFNSKGLIYYRIDRDKKPCAWKDGQMVNSTIPINLLSLPTEAVKKTDEASFLENAAANNDCVYRSDY